MRARDPLAMHDLPLVEVARDLPAVPVLEPAPLAAGHHSPGDAPAQPLVHGIPITGVADLLHQSGHLSACAVQKIGQNQTGLPRIAFRRVCLPGVQVGGRAAGLDPGGGVAVGAGEPVT